MSRVSLWGADISLAEWEVCVGDLLEYWLGFFPRRLLWGHFLLAGLGSNLFAAVHLGEESESFYRKVRFKTTRLVRAP